MLDVEAFAFRCEAEADGLPVLVAAKNQLKLTAPARRISDAVGIDDFGDLEVASLVRRKPGPLGFGCVGEMARNGFFNVRYR